MDVPQLSDPPFEGCSGCFQVLVITSKTAVNTCVQVSAWTGPCFSGIKAEEGKSCTPWCVYVSCCRKLFLRLAAPFPLPPEVSEGSGVRSGPRICLGGPGGAGQLVRDGMGGGGLSLRGGLEAGPGGRCLFIGKW